MKSLKILSLLLAMFGLQASGHNLKVWMDSPTFVADGKTVNYLTVYQTDITGTDYVLYTNFQMQLNIPEGITIAQKKEGRNWVNDVNLDADRFDGVGATLESSQPGKTAIKLALANNTSNTYYQDDIDGNIVEKLFTIGLIADPSMKNGTIEITMSDVKFILADASANIPAEQVKTTVTITGGTSEGTDIPFTMSEAGYGTLILPFAAELPEGLKAYKCTALDGTTVQTEEQTQIVANTPLLIAGTAGNYTFTGIPSYTENSYTEGLLTGVLTSTSITDGYVLQNLESGLGFYQVEPGSSITVPANKCYLTVSSEVKYFDIDIPLADGIEKINNCETLNGTLYNINGQTVNGSYRGIIIKNNRKYYNR